ncbi:MAG: hypothetical protein HY084_06530 [Gemmatimonadetes bacterium]|nr:hypothetical protein [Gemmatimonadota bacterium]
MYRHMFAVQWKWARAPLAALCVLGMMVPALAMRVGLTSYVSATPRDLTSFTAALGVGLAFLAIVTGAAVQSAGSWPDVHGKYVYALSLPIAWREYLFHRTLIGLTLLLLPALAVWLGGWLAVATVPLPDTLHTYAGGVAFRFLLASVLSFAVWTALVQLSGRRVTLVALLCLLALLVTPLVLSAIGLDLSSGGSWNWLIDPPSPVSVFVSRWALIDV